MSFLSAGISAVPEGLSPVAFTVSETATDAEVATVECVASDITSPTFKIDNITALFQISRIGNSNLANIIRTAELDYDSGPSSYHLLVTCTDSTGSVSDIITVNIEPVNDHLPTYETIPPLISINETTPAGTVLASQGSEGLVQIIVSDNDRGEDGVLTFRFASTTDDALEATHFSMNETDGTIYLTNQLDVDVDLIYTVTLNVVVCDGDRAENMCRQENVVVVIASVNEFDPQFTESSYSTRETVYNEGDYASHVIASVQCTDSDRNVGAIEGIHLLSSEVPLVLVEQADGSADLVLNGTLDYEVIRMSEVEVELLCSDNGARSDTAKVTLHIQGLDDNLPEFTDLMYNVEVKETYSVNTQVLVAQCSDADYGAGALVGVQLLNPNSEAGKTFRVDSKTGVITLDKSLDYDKGLQSYVFTVLCTDSASNEAVAGVNITVLGVNDEPVRFTMSEYNFTVNRLELPGVVVGHLETRDDDIEPEQQITYSIEDNTKFDIDRRGRVILQHFILFLEGDHFRLTITASDSENDDATTLVIVAVDGYFSVLDIVLIIAGVVVLPVIIVVIIAICCIVKQRRR